jgi:hypothetical protein
MKKARRGRLFAGKSAEDLERLTAGLDREFAADAFGPLNEAEARLWRRAKRKRGRPRIGKGAKVVSVSIEKGLLKRSDRLAERLGTSRARLIAAGLERLLASYGSTGRTGTSRAGSKNAA